VLAACWLGSAERRAGWTDIRAAVYEELVTDPLIDADDIVVEVFNGDVSLEGTVPSQGPAWGGARHHQSDRGLGRRIRDRRHNGK